MLFSNRLNCNKSKSPICLSKRSDKNEIELSSQSAVSMLLILKLISSRIRDAKQNCGIIQNPRFENRIYSNFESRMEHLNILNEADVELKLKLQDQMKFLTALGILSRYTTSKTRM